MEHTKKLAVLLALSVAAFGSTARAEVYTTPIWGNKDKAENTFSKIVDGNTYIYTFQDGDALHITDTATAIAISYPLQSSSEAGAIEKIIIQNPLDIQLNLTDFDISTISDENPGDISGIRLGYADKVIERSGGGDISVIVDRLKYSNIEYQVVNGIMLGNVANSKIDVGNTNLTAKFLNVDKGGYVYGINAMGNGSQVILGNGSITTEIASDSASMAASNITAFGTYVLNNAQIQTGDISINVSAKGGQNTGNVIAYGAFATNQYLTDDSNSSITLGKGDVTVSADNSNSSGMAQSYALMSVYNGEVDKATENNEFGGTITSLAKGSGALSAFGVMAGDGGTVRLGNVNVSAETEGNGQETAANSIGLYTQNGGHIEMAGGTISAKTNSEKAGNVYAIRAVGENDTVKVNEDTANDVIIYGDVRSGDKAAVLLNLNTTNSQLNGSIRDDNTGVAADTGVTLTLDNGAAWNNGAGFDKTIASNVTSLSMDGGVVNQLSTQDMTIQNYSGTGDFLFQADSTAPDGVLSFDASQTGHVVIEKADAGSKARLSVSNQTIDTLDPTKAEDSLNALAHQMVYLGGDDALTGTVALEEGLITPQAAGDLNFYEVGEGEEGHGYVTNVTRGPQETATMNAMKHIAATAILAWRQEDSTFSQRLGDLRRSAGGQGLWARMSRGEFKYDGEYKNQYDFYQLGYDRASGAWHYGAAFSYNDGETSYRAGYGENSSAALSLYGTWLGEKGHYADIVLKGGKLSNEYTITTAAGRTHGDYDLWGVSLSGEYGREIALADGWFVTPQAQMTLLHIGSEDYTTSNGIRVSQESLDSAVGRVGLEAGKRFGAGRVYGKFSLLHDFAGSADTWLRYEGLENSYREDIGDTWCEAGFGVNLRLTDSTYFYADVARTFGGDIETPWQWNAGVRWGF